MSSEKTKTEIPVLKLTEIKLVSLLYRVKNVHLLPNTQSDIHLEGSINYRLYGRRKNSFKMRATQRIEAEGLSFRVRHEARFSTDTPITKNLFNDIVFQNKAINEMVPFGSELFAGLTSKSCVTPIITPGKIELTEETEIVE